MPCLLVTGDWFVWWLDLLVAWSVGSFCLICCFRGWVWGGLASVAVLRICCFDCCLPCCVVSLGWWLFGLLCLGWFVGLVGF